MQPSRRSLDPPQWYIPTSNGPRVSQGPRFHLHTESRVNVGQHGQWSNNTARNHAGSHSFPTRDQAFLGNHQAHSFHDVQQPRNQIFGNLSFDLVGQLAQNRVSQEGYHADSPPYWSSVRPLPRQYEDRSSGVRGVRQPGEHHHPRSQSFDGFVQLHGRRFKDAGHFHPLGSVSSPSTSMSDVDVPSDLDGQSGIEQDVKQETKNLPPSTSQARSDERRQPTTKSSRYLREMDRRTILWRLSNGEKQAALAKEFNVSRSTICNLYKQRQAVWARHDENPLSLHPKKSRRRALASSAKAAAETRSPSVDSPMEDKNISDQEAEKSTNIVEGSVVEVKSRALSLLLTTIRNRETSSAHFQRCCSRAMRLLLEESLTLANEQASMVFEPSRPLYAISLERHANVILETFHDIEPEIPSMEFWPPFSGRHQQRGLQGASGSLKQYDVVLLDMATTSADLIRTVIRALRGCGVQESRLSLVSLFVSDDVITQIVQEHPLVRIFTASIDPVLPSEPKPSKFELESASRMFLERLHTLEG